MKINTAYFGTQEVDPESVIVFPEGLPGFEGHQTFKMFHEEGKPTVFWLQSVDDSDLAFSVAPPELFNIFYEMVLSDSEMQQIKLAQPEDAAILLVLSKDDGEEVQDAAGGKVRANLQGPLVINLRDRLGIQKIIPRLSQASLLRAEQG